MCSISHPFVQHMQSQKTSWDFCTLLPKGHFLRVSSLNSFWHTTLGCKSNTPIITFSLLFSTWTIRYNLLLFLKYMSDPFGIQLSADIQFMFEMFSHLLFSTTIQLLKMRQWTVSFFTWLSSCRSSVAICFASALPTKEVLSTNMRKSFYIQSKITASRNLPLSQAFSWSCS